MNRIWKLTAFVLVMSSTVFAAGTGLSWETPLITLKNSFTGPVAAALGTLAFMGAGLAAYHHQELGHLAQGLSRTTIGVAAAVGAGGIVAVLFGVSGAVV